MFARSGSRRRRGVSLSEALVSLLILTMVMIVALTLLFTMKSFGERQQVKTAPRQTSRRAIDYVGAFVAGATDLNDRAALTSPNAIVTWYALGGANTPTQASFNDLPVGSPLGEPGTDIVTVAAPTSPVGVLFTKWPNKTHTDTAWLDYREGCPVNADLEANFRALTGSHSTGGGPAQSAVLVAYDANGAWRYYQITEYKAFDCSSVDAATGLANPVQVVANPSATDVVNPPGGEPDLIEPVNLAGGMRFVSFRIRRDGNGIPNLEQKQGLFNPGTDNPGTAFAPIMPDVEDLQVAYLYSQSPDGTGRTVFNTYDASTNSVVLVQNVAANNRVPPQGTGSLWDVSRISGLRVSVTSRSAPLRFETSKISVRRGATTVTNGRPRSEDRAGAGPDDFEVPGATAGLRVGDFDHFRMTSTLLIRNRMLGN